MIPGIGPQVVFFAMKRNGLVIFDCDGVVVDSEVLSCQSLVDVLRQYDVPITLDQVFDKFLGKSFSVVEAYYVETTGKPQAGYLARVSTDRSGYSLEIPEVVSRLARSSFVRSNSDAPRLSSNCSRVRAPTITDDTAGLASSQARAT